MTTPTCLSEWAAQHVGSNDAVELVRAQHRARMQAPHRAGPLADMAHPSVCAMLASAPTGLLSDARREHAFYRALSVKFSGNASLAPLWWEQDRSGGAASWSHSYDHRPAPSEPRAVEYVQGRGNSADQRWFQRFVFSKEI